MKHNNSKISPELIKEVVNFKQKKVERYYFTVLFTIALKEFFKNYSRNCLFVGAEIKLSANGQDYVRPDIVLQANSEVNSQEIIGLPIEVKSSLSNNEDIIEELKKMERYNPKLKGWNTRNHEVDNHVIIFSPYYEDAGRVKYILDNELTSNKLDFKRPFLLWSWALMLSKDEKEVVIVRQEHGEVASIGLPSLNKTLLTGEIKINTATVAFAQNFEGEFFTRQEPPPEYVMEQLWNRVFPRLCVDDDVRISPKDICSFIDHNFPLELLRDANGNNTGLPISWAKKAMHLFEKIGLTQNIGDGKYLVFFRKKIKKNFQRYICECLAKKQITSGDDGDVNKIIMSRTGFVPLTKFAHKEEEFK